MEISDNKISFDDEILDTNTMTVTTKDDPKQELIPSITFIWNSKKHNYPPTPDNLKITIKNRDDVVLKSVTFKNRDDVVLQSEDAKEFTCKDERITPNTTIEFEFDGYTDKHTFGSFLGKTVYYMILPQKIQRSSYVPRGFTFDVKDCFMPVVLELYCSFSYHNAFRQENGVLEAKIRTGLLEKLKDILSIPEPLLEESFRYTHIFFLFSSVQPNFQKRGTSLQKVYEVKSMEKNPCNFYHEFLALANFRLKNETHTTISTSQKIQLPPDLTKFYILFKPRYTYARGI